MFVSKYEETVKTMDFFIFILKLQKIPELKLLTK